MIADINYCSTHTCTRPHYKLHTIHTHRVRHVHANSYPVLPKPRPAGTLP